MAFAPDSATLASAGWDQSVRLWDVGTGRERSAFRGHSGPVSCVAFAPDGRTLASGVGNPILPLTLGELRLWQVATGRQQPQLLGHRCGVTCLAFAPDGRTLVSGGYDETVRLWDVDARPRPDP